MRKHGRILMNKPEERRAIIEGDVARIPLGEGGRQGYAIVDKEYAHLDKYCWQKHYEGYAQARIDGKIQRMHRVIASPKTTEQVDHKNHDTLDNRKSNLRVCSATENRRNRKKAKSNTTGYKGVVLASSKRYTAKLGYLGKKLHLGTYDTAIDAAKAYDRKAKQLHGEFALLNFN